MIKIQFKPINTIWNNSFIFYIFFQRLILSILLFVNQGLHLVDSLEHLYYLYFLVYRPFLI